MIRELLPDVLGVAEVWGAADGAQLLFGEAAAIDGAGEVRAAEFVAGRSCARRALAHIGHAPQAIPRAPDGSPVWPEGIVGSITHTRGYAAAAVDGTSRIRSIGVDAEPHKATRPSVVQRITLDDEQQHLIDLSARHHDIHWDRVLFSAKEAVYKAWAPLTRRTLHFKDVAIQLDPSDGTFSARVLLPDRGVLAPHSLSGRWLCSEIVLTAVIIPHEYGRPCA